MPAYKSKTTLHELPMRKNADNSYG